MGRSFIQQAALATETARLHRPLPATARRRLTSSAANPSMTHLRRRLECVGDARLRSAPPPLLPGLLLLLRLLSLCRRLPLRRAVLFRRLAVVAVPVHVLRHLLEESPVLPRTGPTNRSISGSVQAEHRVANAHTMRCVRGAQEKTASGVASRLEQPTGSALHLMWPKGAVQFGLLHTMNPSASGFLHTGHCSASCGAQGVHRQAQEAKGESEIELGGTSAGGRLGGRVGETRTRRRSKSSSYASSSSSSPLDLALGFRPRCAKENCFRGDRLVVAKAGRRGMGWSCATKNTQELGSSALRNGTLTAGFAAAPVPWPDRFFAAICAHQE